MQMSHWTPRIVFTLPVALLFLQATLHYPLQTIALVGSSAVLFLLAALVACGLYGYSSSYVFAALGLSVGWFAEQMGSTRGWFFGSYTYTDVLGPKLGDVPFVIPLMWFALCLIALVMAKLILWRDPMVSLTDWPKRLLTALLAAMLVTAFDLGADPYFVFVLKAWIMTKTDGGWFGETLQGFVGWMVVSFFILLAAQVLMRSKAPGMVTSTHRRLALLPIGIYASGMIFQMFFGHPIETRTVALFAMGVPTLIALVAWWQWQKEVH